MTFYAPEQQNNFQSSGISLLQELNHKRDIREIITELLTFPPLHLPSEQEAEVEEERQRKEREARERRDEKTLDKTREQIQALEIEHRKLQEKKQELFLTLKKLLNEDENRKKQQQKETNEMYAMMQQQSAAFMPPPPTSIVIQGLFTLLIHSL